MTIKESKDIQNLAIPPEVRLKKAIMARDYGLIAKDCKKKFQCDMSVEAFSYHKLGRDPDSLGITIFYPNKEQPTHMLTGIWSASIKEKGFEKEVKKLIKKLKSKIKGK